MTAIDAQSAQARAPASWLVTGAGLALAYAIAVAAYSATVGSAVHLWMTRDAYSYAFAILPIVGYLVLLNRSALLQLAPSPALGGAAVAFAFSAFWFFATRLEIQELQHLAVPGMLIGLAIAAIGWRAAAILWLPLAYLFLLAPSGTPLLPFLQTITTWIANAFLTVGQIPFYAEGHNIEVATGKYLVAPGCAGLNFILAALTVVPLFCEIMYRDFHKKLIAFLIMMALVPVANGFRVFGIIAIAEYSHRAIDIAADHLLYGWMFFSCVLLLMFLVASRFSDPVPPKSPAIGWPAPSSINEFVATPAFGRLAVALALATLAVCLPPLLHGLTS